MRRIALLLSAMALAAISPAVARDGFAVVIDPLSLAQARTEVTAYIRALEEVQGFHVYTVEDRWGVPDSIRAELMRLHALPSDPIVGAVFVGDIPVPMVRDAQFLTSAFKMNQSMPWRDSSVPSDRYYDDFGLRFNYLRRDTAEWSHLFYYSLAADGNQRLHPDLFTGRIRPTDAGGTSRYDKLRQYLRKAVAAKLQPEPFTSVFTYTGSGSVNESRTAHISEQASMREHFPALALRPGAFDYLDYTDAPFIKRRLMNQMMRPDLSLGFMHHHGDFDTQYLTHAPKPTGTEQTLDYLLRSYRQRLRTAARYGQDVDSVRRVLTERDHLPADWLDGQPSALNNHLDSLLDDSLNLTLKDFATYAYRPNCRVAIYDACYNAAFHNDDCIANEYIFQPGRTMAGIGGTVNVLQDKWPDHLVGLLADGLMVGRLNQLSPELEMHVVGDPTYCFRPQQDTAPQTAGQRQAPTPDAQSLAILLADTTALTDAALLALQRTAPSGLVRLEAFQQLCRRNSPLLVEAISTAALDDSYELLQRMAVNVIPRCGHPDLAPVLARIIVQPSTSARVAFNAAEALQFMPAEAMTQALTQALDSITPYVTWPDDYRDAILKQQSYYAARWDDDIIALCEGRMNQRRALVQADRMKIYLPPYLAARVAAYTERCGDPDLQLQLLSTLGWHRLAYTHADIAAIARRMSRDTTLPTNVRAEALKTLKRLQ